VTNSARVGCCPVRGANTDCHPQCDLRSGRAAGGSSRIVDAVCGTVAGMATRQVLDSDEAFVVESREWRSVHGAYRSRREPGRSHVQRSGLRRVGTAGPRSGGRGGARDSVRARRHDSGDRQRRVPPRWLCHGLSTWTVWQRRNRSSTRARTRQIHPSSQTGTGRCQYGWWLTIGEGSTEAQRRQRRRAHDPGPQRILLRLVSARYRREPGIRTSKPISIRLTKAPDLTIAGRARDPSGKSHEHQES
jgi:hypothetical protein